eukprot:g18281.t1
MACPYHSAGPIGLTGTGSAPRGSERTRCTEQEMRATECFFEQYRAGFPTEGPVPSGFSEEEQEAITQKYNKKYENAKGKVLEEVARPELAAMDDKTLINYIKTKCGCANAELNSSRPEKAMKFMKEIFCAAHEYVFQGFVDDYARVPTELVQKMINEWEVPPPKYANPARKRTESEITPASSGLTAEERAADLKEESDALHVSNNVLLKRIIAILEGPDEDLSVGGMDSELAAIKRMINRLDDKLSDLGQPLN